MFTSDIENKHFEETKRICLKTSFVFLVATLICAIFGAVYEIFSHQVFSFFMIYAFSMPLALGVLPYMCFYYFTSKRLPDALSRLLYNCGTATLTVGCIVQGVLEIYGTENPLIYAYPIVGSTAIVFGIAVYLIRPIKNNIFL